MAAAHGGRGAQQREGGEGLSAATSTARRGGGDAVDDLVELEHEARGHGVEHQVVVGVGAEHEAAAGRGDAHRDHHLGYDHEHVEDEPREARDAGEWQVDLRVLDGLVGRIHPPVHLELLVRLRRLEHGEPEVHVVGLLQVAEAQREEGDHAKHLENRRARIVVTRAIVGERVARGVVQAAVRLADSMDEIVREGELRVVRGQQRHRQPRLHRKPQRVPVRVARLVQPDENEGAVEALAQLAVDLPVFTVMVRRRIERARCQPRLCSAPAFAQPVVELLLLGILGVLQVRIRRFGQCNWPLLRLHQFRVGFASGTGVLKAPHGGEGNAAR
eukprot:scaffold38351_cov63-Phaeocystis_antarctica.AAC.10